MKSTSKQRLGASRVGGLSALAAALLSCVVGCEAPPDKRFAAQTYDEYTEPLTSATLGSPSEGVGPTVPDTPGQASWLFNDCSSASNFLVDSSGGGANAQHALKGSCVPGIDGLAVQVRTVKDVVQVPDEPQFTVGPRVGVAAWVNPTTVNGDQPIIIKRLNNRTAFSLGIHNGNVEMSVVLTTGATVLARAAIAPNVWTHVGGLFDGASVSLFINGQPSGQVLGAGTIRNVFAPLRIGATTQTQHFNGAIDDVFVSTLPDARDQIIARSCVERPSLITVNPATSGPVPSDTTVHYDVSLTDNDLGACELKPYNILLPFFDPNLGTSFTTDQAHFASPGETFTFGVDVTGNDDAAAGEHQVPFIVGSFGSSPETLPGQLVYVLIPPDCPVSTRRELMITSTSVVDDPVRTSATGVAGPGSTATPGVWTFGHLMRELAPTPEDAPAVTLQLFQHWLTDQNVNGFTVAARPLMQQRLLDAWPRTATGELDLDRAPLILLAIVNRVDLRDLAAGTAGEGRVVFGVTPFGSAVPFTVILEYHLVAQTQDDVMAWVNRWHALSSHPFPSEEYNAALEDITTRFTARNAQPGAANGSALDELRTNEIVLSPSGSWQLRAFALSPTSGFFDQVTVKETPDLSFDGTAELGAVINNNAAAIKAVVPAGNGHTLPEQMLGGAVINTGFGIWNAPGIADPEARFHMSLNTCNGCHGRETGTAFLMVSPRFPGGPESILSPFLTGTSVADPVTGQRRTLGDLARRRLDLIGLVCGTGDGGTAPPLPPADAGTGG